MSTRRFQRRFIAFVDILGFRSIVDRMAEEGQLFLTVRDVLKDLDQQSRSFQRYRRKVRDRKKGTFPEPTCQLYSGNTQLQMTAFSDCYVLSEVSPSWHVLAAVQSLGARFLKKGILTRGAVVHGDAYHQGRVLFGPGIVEAYKLESEVAKYPRILVTEPVRQAVWGYHTGLCKERLLKRDVDGCWFVNVLVPPLSSWVALSDATIERDMRTYLKNVRRSLIDQLQRSQGNVGHVSKVLWMVHNFNEAAAPEGVDIINFD